jgi:hypothetical protein
MTTTYLNDESFFTLIWISGLTEPFSETLLKWSDDNIAKFRFIHDPEARDWHSNYNLAKAQEYYPGIKAVSVVVNPWARVWWLYDSVTQIPEGEAAFKNDLKLGSFEEFVTDLPNALKNSSNWPAWWVPSTSQSEWVTSKNADGTTHRAEYVLRAENFAEDVRPLAEYFSMPVPAVEFTPVEYQSHYNDQTKAIVEDLFKDDIAWFGYTF